mmetsp:Transcript_59482/g.105790  ORF Transcript_59482/g.105790 Transcript_59482/m.105790 type:complete len:134 (-) Transcript_59482:120-521(-)|eukprot:CAMPEP_0197660178 /NCGR_PEP_ID=MMETSP1338-20131121/50693_1 /TAXON_ID=43686 ORGANISM="Pelagodinium beii, Strain RCC1491" /NCGR_SAMPLE_ID=MMETSP1338 /ASSEMBLY_ACC=CAM_ASM_000754 /LENGTH=133 /DNA_ID=CAMNT_0043237475 /DNA_START=52 /DNA_END=453 /DNA_ORIENTATION=-
MASDAEAMASSPEQAEANRMFDAALEKLQTMVKTESCLIFSTTVCPWCDRAADFFKSIQRPCRKINLDEPAGDQAQQMFGMALGLTTRQRTVPNIFIAGKHIGGYDVLLEAQDRCKKGTMPTEHSDVCALLVE